MLSSLDLDLNIADRRAQGRLKLVGSKVMAGSNGQKPLLIRNSAGPVTIRAWVPSNNGDREFDNVDLATATVRRAIGPADRVPATGTLPLAPLSVPVTSGLLAAGKRYFIKTFVAGDSFINVGATSNASGVLFTATGTTPTTWTNASALQEVTADLSLAATATEVQTALNATAAVAALGGVTVTKLGAGSYEVLFTNLGAQQAMEGPVNWNMDAGSVVSVSRIVPGSATVREIQLVRLLVNPYCYGEFTTALPAADYTVSTIQGATADLPATKRLTLDPQPYDGHIVLTLDDNDPFEVPFDASAAQIASLAGERYVVSRKAENAWDISGVDPAQDVTITADVSKLVVPIGVTGEMPLNTVALHRAFAATTAKTITLLDQVDITWPGELPRKVYQAETEFARDILDLSAIVPTPIPASDFATLSGLIAGKQPIHANLVAIAALAMTPYGRDLLTKVDELDVLDYISGQPLNDNLTEIGELITAGYGRDLLTAVNAAVARLMLGAAPLASPNFTDGLSFEDDPFLTTPFARDFSRADGPTSAWIKLGLDRLEINVAAKAYDASPLATDAYNTLAIQAAINAAIAEGRGVVRVTRPGVYKVNVTSELDTVYYNLANPNYPVTESSCLILRGQVLLKLDPGVIIESQDPTKTVISCIDMKGGGIVGGGHVKSIWTPEGPAATGHGIMLHVSEPGESTEDFVIDGIRISHVASYGFSASQGNFLNNRYSRMHVTDTGADAIDHKVRPVIGLPRSRGVSFKDIVVERFGLRTDGSGRAGLDLRGPATIEGFWALDFAKQGQATVGLRFNAGIFGEDGDEPSSYSLANNVHIDSGDPSVTDSVGIILSNSEGTRVSGVVRNCYTGVIVGNAGTTGFPTSRFAQVANVIVEGSRGRAFDVSADDVSVINCTALGAVDTFQEKQGNLTLGQTVINLPRPHDIATLQVWKNSVLLAGGYTVNDAETITLAAGLLLTDVLDIITPGGMGFYTSGARTRLVLPQTLHVTTPIGGTALATLIRDFNSSELSIINRSGVNTELMRFNTERPWSLWQRGTAGGTWFSLENITAKRFGMTSETPGVLNLDFSATDVGAYIKINGVTVATTAVLDAAIAALVDTSPATLNTFNELAAALGDDPNFATTIIALIGQKAALAGDIFTGPVTIPTLNVTTITQPAWIDLDLNNGNGWVNFGSTFQTAQYRKDTQGRVHLRGFIKSGVTADTTQICTALPSGYRPGAQVVFGVPYNNGALSMVEIRITTGGTVSLFFATGTATYLSLNGISFSTN